MVKNKVILITGGNTGIGAEVARLLAQNGSKVIINYRENQESAEKLVSEIQQMTQNSNSALALQADVTDEDQVRRMISVVLEQFGKIDVLVNNACPKTFPQNFIDTEWSEFTKFLDVVVKGSYNLTKAVIPTMNGEGAIINVLTAYVIGIPPAKLTPYITAKCALEGLSKSLAAEFGSQGIRVNMVSPGVTKTKFTDHLPEKMFEMISFQTPLKRIATPKDVANAILFLASENSTYLTGINIPVCGGSVIL